MSEEKKRQTLKQAVRSLEENIITISGPALAISGVIAGIEHVIENCQCAGKRCSKCKQVKCLAAFHKDRATKNGLRSNCKVCANGHAKGYYQEHAEEKRTYSKEYRRDHPELIQAANKAYYQENKEQEIARAMAYWVAHPEQKQKHREWLKENAEAVKAYSKKYAVEHAEEIKAYERSHREMRAAQVRRYARRYPEKVNALQHKRRTRKTQAGGSYTDQEWKELKVACDYTCLSCGRQEPNIKLTADHVIPVAKGGSSNIDNIQPLCQPCNSRKGQKIIDYRLTEREA